MRNSTKAYEYFKRSANERLAIAQFYLAECYMFGIGTVENKKDAIEYYEKSAKQEYVLAYDRLCNIYRDGIGVERDLEKALEYNAKTRENGDFNAEVKYLSILKNKNPQKQ